MLRWGSPLRAPPQAPYEQLSPPALGVWDGRAEVGLRAGDAGEGLMRPRAVARAMGGRLSETPGLKAAIPDPQPSKQAYREAD